MAEWDDQSFNSRGQTVIAFETENSKGVPAIGGGMAGRRCGVLALSFLDKGGGEVNPENGAGNGGVAMHDYWEPRIDQGIGVVAVGERVGMLATSPPPDDASLASGIGLVAHSQSGRAAVLQVGTDFPEMDMAGWAAGVHLHLAPVPQSRPPDVAAAGDLYCAELRGSAGGATLWFCVRSAQNGVAAVWKQIA